jgi:hypothetical protein
MQVSKLPFLFHQELKLAVPDSQIMATFVPNNGFALVYLS